MSGCAEPLADCFGKRADVSSGGADDAHGKIASSILVRFPKRAIEMQSLKLMDCDFDRLPLDSNSAPRQLIKLAPFNLLRRIHRRRLLYLSSQTLKRSFKLALAESRDKSLPDILRGGRLNPLAGQVARVGRVAETNHGFVFFLSIAQKLRQPRRAPDQTDQHAGRKRAERARVSDAFDFQDATHARDDIVRGQTSGLVYDKDAIHEINFG